MEFKYRPSFTSVFRFILRCKNQFIYNTINRLKKGLFLNLNIDSFLVIRQIYL